MKRIDFLALCAGLGAAVLFLGGCGGELTPGDDDASQDVSTEPVLKVEQAVAVSRHYVEVIFSRSVGPEAAVTGYYSITDPDARVLPVLSARIMGDGTRVLLTTGEQEEVEYRLAVNLAAITVRTARLTSTQAVFFRGSPAQEPYVISAIALSPTSVLVSYSGPMDSNLQVAANYEIANPDLDVLDVTVSTTKTSVVLMTSEQEDVDYTLRVTNVTSNNGSKLLNPTRNTVSFNGIAPDEPPEIISAAATNASTVLVNFNKPLADEAADPARFSISPGGVVTAARMGRFNTQVELTALPLVAGRTYTLTVTGIKDRGGTPIAPPGGPNDPDCHCQATFTYEGPTGAADLPPRVVGAASQGNTSVIIVFSKPMGDSALNPANYFIVQENVHGEVGTLLVLGPQKIVDGGNAVAESEAAAGSDDVQVAAPGSAVAVKGTVITTGPDRVLQTTPGGDDTLEATPRFAGSDRTAVILTTSSQNEVTYRIRAVGIKDLAGNELAPPTPFVDPNSAVFPGTPPSANSLVDSDGDGIPDHIELRGYVVTVVNGNGQAVAIEVTSDPTQVDSDLDGLDDLVEKQINTNPRTPDTDGDGVSDYDEFNVYYTSPLHQDTDADGLDDNLEIYFFKTSGLLDDTDGDGLLDGDEIIAGNRNPRIADLPQPAISIGEMALRLDTRFAYTDTEGVSQTIEQTNTATLTQSEQRTFSTSDTETMQHVIEAGFEGGLDQGAGTAKGSIQYSFTYETSFSVSQESVSATQNEYQESLSTSVQRDITKEVTRSVENAAIDLVVTLSNFGDIPFTMSNLEVTALLQDPFNRRRLLPVASLLPASQLAQGDFEVFLGPFIQERGPFIFKSTEVFPSLVEDLMKNPRGLIFKVANFDVVDEQGRNFAFISQLVNDRTAGLIIDYGNGQVDRYRVATNSTFDDQGRPRGITMAYALQDILGLQKNGPHDAITVGPNGCAETFAVGDDIQVVQPICYPVAPGETIIEAGPNGVLETLPMGDDRKSSDGLRIIDGGDGCAHTRAQRDDIQVVGGDCATGGLDGVVILAGPDGVINTVPSGDDQLTTVSGYGTEMTGKCDGKTTNMKQIIEPFFGGNGIANTLPRAGSDDVAHFAPGDPVSPGAVIIDAGPDGILQTRPIGDEILWGPGCLCETDDHCPGEGTCRKVERLVRVKGVQNVPEEARLWVVITPQDVNAGIDFDALPLQAGRTYSLAFVQDQDMDGLYDREEFLYGSSDRDDNTDGCPLGDGAPGCDTTKFDFDTVRDFEEVKTGWQVQVVGQASYPVFSNPVLPDTDADNLFDDQERQMGTDPAKRDTDGDGISDHAEVTGYQIFSRDGRLIRNVVPYQSAMIVPGPNGQLDTSGLVGDDELGQDPTMRPIITPGPNGILDSLPEGDDLIEGTFVILDGGNGIPETVASVNDVQVGPSPVATRTVTVTFVDYQPGGNACDGSDKGEFRFDLRVRKGVETLLGQHTEKAVIDRFETHFFGGYIRDNGNGVANTVAAGDDVQVVPVNSPVSVGGIVIAPGPNGKLDTTQTGGDDVIVQPTARYSVPIGLTDTLAISASILEDDPVCDANTRSVIIEPATGGNQRVDTLALGDDVQLIPFGNPVAAAETIIRSCPGNTNGTLDSIAASPGLCEAVITAGPNGVADTLVNPASDDVQVVAHGTDGLAAGTVVISPGPNGRIDTAAAGDDDTPGATLPCEPVIMEPATGGNGTADTMATGDDIQVVAPSTAVAPGTVLIRPGPNGVINTIPTGDDVKPDPLSVPLAAGCSACPSGQCGTECSVCPSNACFGDDIVLTRAEGDSCEDGWLSANPHDLCPCGQCRQFDSTPTPSTFDHWAPQAITFDIAALAALPPDGTIVTFEAGPGCFSSAKLRVRVEVTSGAFVTPGAVLVRAGADGVLDTIPFGDDVIGVPHKALYATNPLDRDTDGDTLFDGAEQILGANPNDAMDAQRFRDNDLDGLPNGVETDGWILAYVDSTGALQCLTETGTMLVTDESNPPPQCRVVRSDPFEPDSDFDGLPDLLEYIIRSDPSNPDTDGDGLLDYDEFDPNSRFSIPVLKLREFQRLCAQASRCEFTPSESAYGLSIVLADTDQDGRTDREEIEEYWIIAPCVTQQGGTQQPGLPRKVFSSPVDADFDLDGLPDGLEKAMFLDPANPDTDGDGVVDSLDPAPDGCGKRVTITLQSYSVQDDCEGSGDGEFRFRLWIAHPDGTMKYFNQNADNLDDNETHYFPTTFTTTFSIRPGQTFRIGGHVFEEDDSSGDEDWYFSRTYDFNVVTGQQTIKPNYGEADDGCFDDHTFTLQFTVGQL